MQKPMTGVRVLEVAQFTFVPSAGAVLADWGADVIKIENPLTGDAQRGLVTVAGRSARYAGRNAGSLGDVEQISGIVRQQVLAQRLQSEGIDAKRVSALTGVASVDLLVAALDLKTDRGREAVRGVALRSTGRRRSPRRVLRRDPRRCGWRCRPG